MHKEVPVLRVRPQELKVLKGLKEFKGQLVHKDYLQELKVLKEDKEPKEVRVLKDYQQEPKVLKERPDFRVLQELHQQFKVQQGP